MGMCQGDITLTSTDTSGHQIWKAWKMTLRDFSKRIMTDHFSTIVMDGWMDGWNTSINKYWKKCLCCYLLSYKKSQACITKSACHLAHMSTQFQDMGSLIVRTLSQIWVTFTALEAGEWLSKPMLSETTKMFMLCKCASERLMAHHYIEYTAMF